MENRLSSSLEPRYHENICIELRICDILDYPIRSLVDKDHETAELFELPNTVYGNSEKDYIMSSDENTDRMNWKD